MTGPRAEYQVPRYEVVQLMPSSGIRAAFRDTDGTVCLEQVVALAVCRVYLDTYRTGGKLIRRGKPDREVCGIVAGDGFYVCEGMSNLLGYVPPGEEIPDDWRGKT